MSDDEREAAYRFRVEQNRRAGLLLPEDGHLAFLLARLDVARDRAAALGAALRHYETDHVARHGGRCLCGCCGDARRLLGG